MILNLLHTNSSSFAQQLEWDLLCSLLSSHAKLAENRKKLQNPLDFEHQDLNEVFQTLSLFIDTIQNESDFNDWPLQELYEFRPLIDQCEKGVLLELKEINFFCTALEYLPHLPETLLNRPPYYFSKTTHKTNISNLIKQLVRPLRSFVSQDGEVDYSRHPLLSGHYKHLHDFESQIRIELKKIQSSSDFVNDLQFDTYDFIDDRYVLAIKSDHYKHFHGKIIRRSETGQTLFVEPPHIRGLSNKRFELVSQIDEIILKINKTFNLILADNLPFIKSLSDIYLYFDDYLARAKFCEHLNLHPPLIRQDGGLHFKNLFHPLIANAVKNDLSIDLQKKGIIVSGPNTGGKTALLKSVALAILLSKKGLFVPADESIFPEFRSIFYIGNDQQNLSLGLSSFSSEVKNFLSVIQELQAPNLVIIDEVFNSTSSEEASALALATFDYISSASNSTFVVSTHHQMLKSYIYQRDDFISGHMGFDSKDQRPTYKLSMNGPGSSMALSIFSNLSLQHPFGEKIVKSAHQYLEEKQISYENLLSSLSSKESDLDKKIAEVNSLRLELLNQKKSNDSLLRIKLNQEIELKRSELEKILTEARDWTNSLPKNVSFDLPSKQSVFNKISQFEKKIATDDLLDQQIEEPEHSPTVDFFIQKNYYCSLVKKNIVLVELLEKKGMARIRHGQMTLLVPLKTLSNPKQDGQARDKFIFNYQKNEVSFTLDCRGMRLDIFENTIEQHLSSLLTGDIPYLSIIHGHGDGVLKSYLRQHLSQRKEFRWEQGENGNDGETKVFLS